MKLVLKAGMVHMVLLGTLEVMVLLDSLDLKDHLVIKAMLQILEIVVDAHPILHLKVTKVLLVNQVILVYLAGLAVQVLLVNLVDVLLVTVESLEQMVNRVMMEPMVDLVNQVSPEDLEIQLMSRILPVQTMLLT